MQEPNLARFADILRPNNENVEKLQDELYELTQKLTLYRDFLKELTALNDQLNSLEDSHNQITKHLTSTFHSINPFRTDTQQFSDL